MTFRRPTSRKGNGRRARQRGLADVLPPALALLMVAFAAAIVIGFIVSFVLPARLLEEPSRRRALTIVAGAWACLFAWFVVKPSLDQEWRRLTIKDCEAQATARPGMIEADGFADEGAVLRKRMILQLLSERRLSFIEIKVDRATHKEPVIALPDGDHEVAWTVSDIVGPWVRLELRKAGDPDCAKHPYGIEGSVNRPPFLPDTCVALTSMKEPSARYVLSLEPSIYDLHVQGQWRIVDRTTGKAAMTLPTVDPWNSTLHASRSLSSPGAPTLVDCLAPHTMLADRIRKIGPRDPAPPGQVLAIERIQAAQDMAAIRAEGPALPAVSADPAPAHWTEPERVALMVPDVQDASWSRAVATAQTQGFAEFGRQLLDWRRGMLSTLIHSAAGDLYPFKVFAVGKSFLVATQTREANSPPRIVIALYRRDGSFAWARQVRRPDPALQICSGFEVDAAYVTTGDLVLADSCTPRPDAPVEHTGQKVTGQVWRIALTALPPMD